MSRKWKHQLYWIWIVLVALSIISLSTVTRQIVKKEFSYSENEPTDRTVIENKVPDDNDAEDEDDGNDGDNDDIGGDEDDGKDGETDNIGGYKVEDHSKVDDQDTENKDYDDNSAEDENDGNDGDITTNVNETNNDGTVDRVSSMGRKEVQQYKEAKTIKKTLHIGNDHIQYSGLSPMAEMELEICALRRIEKYCGHTKHFPRIVTADNTSMTSTLVGTPVIKLNPLPKLEFQDSFEQVNTIVECLRKSQVRHLDIFPRYNWGGSKNMAISDNDKTIALFDFDISIIDEKPLSKIIASKQHKTGPTFEDYAFKLRKSMMVYLGFTDDIARKCEGLQRENDTEKKKICNRNNLSNQSDHVATLLCHTTCARYKGN